MATANGYQWLRPMATANGCQWLPMANGCQWLRLEVEATPPTQEAKPETAFPLAEFRLNLRQRGPWLQSHSIPTQSLKKWLNLRQRGPWLQSYFIPTQSPVDVVRWLIVEAQNRRMLRIPQLHNGPVRLSGAGRRRRSGLSRAAGWAHESR